MIADSEPLSYAQVLDKTSSGRKHLLLGNGFSIACNPMFHYDRLYEFAKEHGLSDRAMGVFTYLGTNNFEGVLRLLQDADWIAQHYDLVLSTSGEPAPFAADLASVKEALLSAIAETHLEDPSKITDERKTKCADFLRPYHNIFTTNYDLLLYWVEMYDDGLTRRDGFLSDEDEPEAPYVVFTEHLGDQQGVFFVHGALHLYMAEGQLRKHTWVRTGNKLIVSVRESLKEDHYPVFVAEGSAPKKLDQIRRSGYLSYCLDKLGRVKNALVTYGLAFGETDDHIAKVIASNRNLPKLYVGLFGDPASDENQAIRGRVRSMQERRLALSGRRESKPLEVEYYDSATAHVWGNPQSDD